MAVDERGMGKGKQRAVTTDEEDEIALLDEARLEELEVERSRARAKARGADGDMNMDVEKEVNESLEGIEEDQHLIHKEKEKKAVRETEARERKPPGRKDPGKIGRSKSPSLYH